MARLGQGREQTNQHRTTGNQQRPTPRPPRPGLLQQQTRQQAVKHQPGRLQRTQQREREGGDLDTGADDVGEQEEEHADLPATAAVGGTTVVEGIVEVLEHVGFALQGQADGLDAGAEEADDDAEGDAGAGGEVGPCSHIPRWAEIRWGMGGWGGVSRGGGEVGSVFGWLPRGCYSHLLCRHVV